MEFLDPVIDKYTVENSEKEPAVLYELYRETWIKVLNPRMIAGHLQGRVISMLSHMISPTNILEIGTFTGYSAICWSEGLTKKGLVDTIDVNEELRPMVERFIKKSGYSDSIKLHTGNALDVIPKLNKQWDIVFLDADKSNYINYFNLIYDQVKPGGYIIADNVLWSGKVVEEIHPKDIDTITLIDYTKMVNSHEGLQTVLFPIRDGLLISRKK